MDVTVEVDAAAVLGQLSARADKIGPRVASTVRHYGVMMQAQVKAHAAGRPGPRIVTGDYSRSLALDVGVSAGGVSVTVGTTRPQARRLEFGAQGVDSLGRRMNSPPYPHFGPAFDKVAPQFLDALERIVDQD